MKRVVVAIVTGLALVAGSSGAAYAQTYSVSIAVSKSVIAPGTALTISGRVSPSAPGKKVTVQKKLSGGAWKNEGVVTVKSNGTYAFSDRPTTTTTRQYRVYKPKSGKINGAYSKAVTVRFIAPQAASVTVTSTGPSILDAGQFFVLSGRTSANLRGRSVQLQVLTGSTWSTLSAAKVTTSATFGLRAKATRAGAGQKVRVYSPGTSATKAAASAVRTFKVYGWRYLNTLVPVSKTGNFTSTQGSVALMSGTPYANSLRALWSWGSFGGWTKGEAQYNLGYHCKTFQARIGVDDTAGERAAWNFAVTGDSLETNYGFVGLGASRVITQDVSSVLRLKLNNTRLNGEPWRLYMADAVWADARVMCAF